jgi:hypothetical protein
MFASSRAEGEGLFRALEEGLEHGACEHGDQEREAS